MRYVALLTALLVAGCAATSRHSPTMGADAPLTGGEAIALINELQDAFEVPTSSLNTNNEVVGPCKSTIPGSQDARTATVSKYTRDQGSDAPAQFACIRYRAYHKVDGARHLHAGIGLADLYCDDFFRRISVRASGRRFDRSLINDVGAAVSAALGLTHVGSAITGGVGAGFGVADGTFRNYDEAFLVSADLPGLQAKVVAEQERTRRSLEEEAPDWTHYAQVNSAILRYANLCSFIGMRHLISKSLNDSSTPDQSLDASLKTVEAYINHAKASRAAGSGTTGGTSEDMSSTPDAVPSVSDTAPIKELSSEGDVSWTDEPAALQIAASKGASFEFPPPLDPLPAAVTLWATRYNVHSAGQASGADAIALRSRKGDPTGFVLTTHDFCLAALEGAVRVTRGADTVTLTADGLGTDTAAHCTFAKHSDAENAAIGRQRFAISPADAPVGLGVAGFRLVPYRTIAVDRNTIPIGTLLFIPQLRGVSITPAVGDKPDGKPFLHDGYVFAADRGAWIKGNHVDFFTGLSSTAPPRFVSSSADKTFLAYVIDNPMIADTLMKAHLRP